MKTTNYRKEVRWSDEDGCYIGSIPEVCGDCCHADTQLEVYAQLIDIEEGWLETWKAQGKTPPTSRRKSLLSRPAPATSRKKKPLKVRAIRESLGMSQTEFAGFLGISVRTLQKWEGKISQPSGAARLLLQVAAKRPEVIPIVRAEA